MSVNAAARGRVGGRDRPGSDGSGDMGFPYPGAVREATPVAGRDRARAPTPGLPRRGVGSDDPRMKTPSAGAAASKPLEPFRKGQVWRIGDINLAVTLVGKTLVHYKRYKTKRHGNQTALSSKPDLERYLRTNNAELVSE